MPLDSSGFIMFWGLPLIVLMTLFHFLDKRFGPYVRYPIALIGLFPLLLVIYFGAKGDVIYMRVIILSSLAWSAAWLETSRIFCSAPRKEITEASGDLIGGQSRISAWLQSGKTMSDTVSNLLLRNLHDVFGETCADARQPTKSSTRLVCCLTSCPDQARRWGMSASAKRRWPRRGSQQQSLPGVRSCWDDRRRERGRFSTWHAPQTWPGCRAE